MIRHILFYGILMQKIRGRTHPDGFEYVQDVRIPGMMYSMGGFPAVIISSQGTINAELWRMDNENLAQQYDGMEGYMGHKDGDMYTRTVVYVPEIDECAWMYTFNSDPTNRPWVQTGDWAKYLYHPPEAA